jgi:hypothetical protein
LLYSHLASEISPGKKIATRFLALTKTKETVIEEHVREANPAAVKRTLAGVGWVVAGGFEKERLRETGPLFFCYQGSWVYWQVGWRVPQYR